MRSNRPRPRQAGYALVLVVIALIVLTAMLGATYRQIDAALRVEAARSLRVVNDGGALQAAAWTLAELQQNGPTNPLPSSGPPPSGLTWPPAPGYGFTRSFLTPTGNYRTYAVTVAPDPSASNQWIVQVVTVPAGP
jgi:hypothetical protein